MSSDQLNKPKKSFKSQSVNNLFRQQTSTIQKSQSSIKSPSPLPSKVSYKIKTISSSTSKLKIIPSKGVVELTEARKANTTGSHSNAIDQTVWKLPKSRSNSPDIESIASKQTTNSLSAANISSTKSDFSDDTNVMYISGTKVDGNTKDKSDSNSNADSVIDITKASTSLSISTDEVDTTTQSNAARSITENSFPSNAKLTFTDSNPNSNINTPRATSKFNDTFNKIQIQQNHRNSEIMINESINSEIISNSTSNLNSQDNIIFNTNAANQQLSFTSQHFSWADDEENDQFWADLKNSIDENIVNEVTKQPSNINTTNILGISSIANGVSLLQNPNSQPSSNSKPSSTPVSASMNNSFSMMQQSPFFNEFNDISNQIPNSSPSSMKSSNNANKMNHKNNHSWSKNGPMLDFRRNTSPLLQFTSNNNSISGNNNHSNNHRNSLQNYGAWNSHSISTINPISDFLNSNLNSFNFEDQFKSNGNSHESTINYNNSNDNTNNISNMNHMNTIDINNDTNNNHNKFSNEDDDIRNNNTYNYNNNKNHDKSIKAYKRNNSYANNVPLTPPRMNDNLWSNDNQNIHLPNILEKQNSKASIWNNSELPPQTPDNILWSPFLNSTNSNSQNIGSISRFFPSSLNDEEFSINDSNVTVLTGNDSNINATKKIDHYSSANAVRANNILSAFEISTPDTIRNVSNQPIKAVNNSVSGSSKASDGKRESTSKGIPEQTELIVTSQPFTAFNDGDATKTNIDISFPKLSKGLSDTSTKKPFSVNNDIKLKRITNSYPEGFSSTFYKRGINNFMFVRELQPKLTNKFKNDRQFIEIRISFPKSRYNADDEGFYNEDDDDDEVRDDDYNNTNGNDEYYSDDDYNNNSEEDGEIEYKRKRCQVVNIDVRELEGKLNGLRISKNISGSKKSSHYSGPHGHSSSHSHHHHHSNSYYYNSKYNSYNSKYTRK